MRRRLIGTALLAVACALAGAPWAQAAQGPLRAGAARAPMRIPAGTPLAGYGSWIRRLAVPDVLGRHPHAFWFTPSEGTLDEIAVRALVLEVGEARVTWISADLIAVDQRFTARVRERLAEAGVRAGAVIVSASHTHSGPGAFLAPALMAVTATDREDPAVRDAILDTIVDVVRRAEARATDARLVGVSIEAPPVTVSRLRADVDREIVALKIATRAGAPIALVWNYAIHGTMFGPRNLRLSGDVMGIAARQLEAALGAPVLFVNGAVGDVSPREHGPFAAEATGRALADAVRAAWARADGGSAATTTLLTRSARIVLPSPRLSLHHCLARWIPGGVDVPLGAFLPKETDLLAVAIGRVAVVTMPGELVTALGRQVKDAARTEWAHAFVAGLSNDYLGYFVRPADDARASYVTCAALYGPRLGPCLAATATELLRRLPEPGGVAGGAAPACDFTGGAAG